MKVKLLVNKDDGRRSGARYTAGQIVDVYPVKGIARNGDGVVVAYWISDANVGLWEGQFELITDADVVARMAYLKHRGDRYSELVVKLTAELKTATEVLSLTAHQMQDPRRR